MAFGVKKCEFSNSSLNIGFNFVLYLSTKNKSQKLYNAVNILFRELLNGCQM
jgi:hypothetical protein